MSHRVTVHDRPGRCHWHDEARHLDINAGGWVCHVCQRDGQGHPPANGQPTDAMKATYKRLGITGQETTK